MVGPRSYGLQIEKFIELWTNKKKTGDSVLVQSKGTETIYFNSIRIWKHVPEFGNVFEFWHFPNCYEKSSPVNIVSQKLTWQKPHLHTRLYPIRVKDF